MGTREAAGQSPIIFGHFPLPDHADIAPNFELRDGAHEIELWHLVARWSLLRLHRDEVLRAFPSRSKSKVGRKPEYDWNDIAHFVRKELDERGDFEDESNAVEGWRSQADLVRLVMDYMERIKLHSGKTPSESTLKARLAPLIAEWRTPTGAHHRQFAICNGLRQPLPNRANYFAIVRQFWQFRQFRRGGLIAGLTAVNPCCKRCNPLISGD